MAVVRAGFSERVFEFSFNAEFADRNRAVLVGAPHIPTQNEEKWLGYDVAFELKRRGGAVHSVALQHKVSRFIDAVGTNNKQVWVKTGGPYFSFYVDTNQYNLIHGVSSLGLSGVEFHFCAPLFVNHVEMHRHYRKRTVEANAIWIDVASAGPIDDDDLHRIVYAADGTSAFRCSGEPVKLAIKKPAAMEPQQEGQTKADFESIDVIYNGTFDVLKEYWPRLRRRRSPRGEGDSFRLPDEPPKRGEPTLANTGALLAKYFGVSWLIEVRK